MTLALRDGPLPQPPAPDGARRIALRGLQAEGATPEERWVRALTALGGALAAEKAGPPHLVALSVRTRDPEAFRAVDPWRLDLLYREALGGNFCPTALLEDASVDLALDAVAHVPPPPKGAIFRGMDAAALAYAYSPRAQAPAAAQHIAQWRREGEAFQTARRTAEIAYGEGPGQRLDLYMPQNAGAGAPPLHVFIHGGYWQALDKKDHGHFFTAFLEAGVAAAVLNYDLLPKDGLTLDDLSEQARRAVEALWRAAPEHGYDRGDITVSGHSAGGHLGAVVAAADWPARAPDLPADLVKGAVLISGLYDLEPLRLTGLNNALRMDAATAVRQSPLHMAPAHPLPVLFAVGGRESAEFHRQSEACAAAWAARGAATEVLSLDGLDHFTALEALGDPASELGGRALRLIAAV